MITSTREQELLGHLEQFGDPRQTWQWPQRDPDYVAALELTLEDVPLLMATARQWVDRTDWPDNKDDLTVYAPIHAWRALAQLGAPEAVGLLIDMLTPMDAADDDWALEEFPHAFALLGPPSLSPLTGYLADAHHSEYARICAAHGLCELGKRHPEVRDGVVGALTDTLGRYAENPESLNGFVVSYLVDLNAVESAEVIERAYAADRVDIQIIGNWNTVRGELGVQGQGLVPPDLANARPFLSFMPSVGRRPALSVDLPPSSVNPKLRRRAQRKRDRRNRKRGRRR